MKTQTHCQCLVTAHPNAPDGTLVRCGHHMPCRDHNRVEALEAVIRDGLLMARSDDPDERELWAIHAEHALNGVPS